MDIKRHLKSALKQLGFDKPRKAQIIPMNTLDAEQDAIVIAATGSGKQIIYETVGLAHSDKLTIVIEPLLALIYNQVQTLQEHDVSADYIDMTRSKEDIDKILNKASLTFSMSHQSDCKIVHLLKLCSIRISLWSLWTNATPLRNGVIRFVTLICTLAILSAS